MARTSGTLGARFSGEFMENLHQHLSQALKQLRQANGWSLTLAAARTGVSKAMLGQIERGESSPTIATLWKIATGFNVPFSFFVQSGAQPSGDVATFSQPNAQMQVKPLLPYDARLRFDLLEVTLAAGAQSDSSAHESGVIEQVVVLEGELLLGMAGSWRRLQAGDASQFAADQPHSYRNPLASPLRFHSLIHYLQRS
jgi:XRE family transcriptional regulator, regulator of sulfur utilization